MNKRNTIFLFTLIILFSVMSCRTTQTRHLTERLFLQPGRISVSHYGQGTDGGSARVLSEQVNYTTPTAEEETAQEDPSLNRLDTNHVYTIPGVTVVSRARFAPVREGHVSIDFVVRVPKEFLSDDYQVCLTPELLHNDSLVMLEDVVLRGSNFIEKQKEDYERYDEFLSTIVDPSGYDTAFINRRAVNREIERRRKSELESYYNNWSSLQEYTSWRTAKQAEFDQYNIDNAHKLRDRLEKHDDKYRTDLARALAMRKDTSALSSNYRSKRQDIIKSAPVQKQITLGVVPAKYREFYLGSINQETLNPLMPQKEDSIRIAGQHVIREQLELNEIKGSRAQETFKRMVPYPYKPEAHYNSTIVSQYDFNYRYTRDYPVTRDLKKLRLTVKGYIAATDRSRYNILRTDTLSFIISSMDELADGSLIANPEFTADQRSEYTHALRLLHNREYDRALKILNTYKDYNTALALTCLGQDGKAYNMLAGIEQNANTHYLAAILCTRLGHEQNAIEHLKTACELDETKIFRTDRDPEVSKLIKKYGLQFN